MRLEIPHSLGKAELRRRIAARIDTAEAKAGALIGGPMALALHWISEDRLGVEASAMGYTVPATLDLTETTMVFDVTIPNGLGFARRMIEGMIRERGEKLLA
ncbi:polyhydroxyalkanoic acid system family protein [Novosphingobium sp.]|uniref:polyhydroxyalkanoic acid system family protein n=1 Tax=Novosphingobium sp. TaxID=1874826 RepID=UPI00333E8829